MKTILSLVVLCWSWAAWSQPILRNTTTTNNPARLPNLLPESTTALYPLMIFNPDGSGADRAFHFSSSFIMTGTNLATGGNLSLNGRTNRLSIANNTLLLDGAPIADTTWTNAAGTSLYPIPTTNYFVKIGQDGQILQGTNVADFGSPSNGESLVSHRSVAKGDVPDNIFVYDASDDENYTYYGSFTGKVRATPTVPFTLLEMTSSGTNGVIETFNLWTDPGGGQAKGLSLEMLRGGSPIFKVTSNGTVTLQGQTNLVGDNGAALTFNGVPISSTESSPVNNFYTTNQFFVSGKGNTLIITNNIQFPYTTLTFSGTNVSQMNFTNSAFKLTLTTNAFIGTPTGFPGTSLMQTHLLHVQQDGTGSKTLTLTNGSFIMNGSGTSTNAVLTINTNANAYTVISFSSTPFEASKMVGVVSTLGQ